MSVIIATFENGELMSSRADDFFRYHDHESTYIDDNGDQASPVGHFTLRCVFGDDVIKFNRTDFATPWVTNSRNLPIGWYIDARGEDGAVWAFHYPDGEAAARRDFDEGVRVYCEWAGVGA